MESAEPGGAKIAMKVRNCNKRR